LVNATSEGEGLGSVFTITLPVDQLRLSMTGESDRPSPSPSRANHDLPTGRLANIKILVVEDDEDARDLLVTVLKQQGAHIEQAGNADDALARLADFDAHVLLSDIGLPGEDGYALIRAVRARGYPPERLPAIALTAYARREDQRLAVEAGFQAHVAKPVEPAVMVAAVADALLVANRR
jgi:CheY-like chemotaxis protein